MSTSRSQLPATKRGAVTFELDRFTANGDRLEVAGHWGGVRGRRFVRPSLRAVGSASSARVLAELDDKPWAADDGGRWTAAFVWTGKLASVKGFELAVAPDLAVELPPPDAEAGADSELVLVATRPTDGADSGTRRATRKTSKAPTTRVEPKPAPVEDVATSNGKAHAAPELSAALARRTKAREEADRAAALLAAAIAERDAAVAARESAVAERDAALAERDATVAEREAAVSERDQATADRDRAIAEHDRLARDRESVLERAETLAGELDERTREHERLLERHQRAAAELADANRAGAEAVAELDLLREERRSAPVTVQTRPLPTTRIGGPTEADWTARALTIAAMAVVVIVLLMIIGAH